MADRTAEEDIDAVPGDYEPVPTIVMSRLREIERAARNWARVTRDSTTVGEVARAEKRLRDALGGEHGA